MCGILGILGNNEQREDTGENLVRFIRPRGPDSMGYRHAQVGNSSLHLWHSRLSIIDISDSASQPMTENGVDWIIAYNGEIYNYIELRQELRKLGWVFRTGSDTEVLLKAWTQWGIDALSKLNGMFAFAISNLRTGEVWLVRDRFGVKPLLWGNLSGGGIIFSSSVAAIAQRLGAAVDSEYCARGLRYMNYENGVNGSPFLGVDSVSAGGWLRLRPTGQGVEVAKGRWYVLSAEVLRTSDRIKDYSEARLYSECETILEDAVRIRLRSDAPLAVSLSGGLDSTTVAAIASRWHTGLQGFTFGSPSDVTSEGPAVDRLSKELNIEPTYIWPTAEEYSLKALLEKTMLMQEAPFSGTSVMAQNCVFERVKSAGFKVLLGGQGGDEAFAGYRKFFFVALKSAFGEARYKKAFQFLLSLTTMMMHEASNASQYLSSLDRYFGKGGGTFEILAFEPKSLNLWGESMGGLAARQISDIEQWSIPTLLRNEDRNSMGHGIESRLPFMDFRVIELALALPDCMKIRDGYGKFALRKIARGTVPDFIRLNRVKRGFDVTQDWISSGLGSALRQSIMDSRAEIAGYLRSATNLDKNLTNAALMKNPRLLDEALMLAWLVSPVRCPD
jgi:asparagine synthase (glutamine-hydrolysing)